MDALACVCAVVAREAVAVWLAGRARLLAFWPKGRKSVGEDVALEDEEGRGAVDEDGRGGCGVREDEAPGAAAGDGALVTVAAPETAGALQGYDAVETEERDGVANEAGRAAGGG